MVFSNYVKRNRRKRVYNEVVRYKNQSLFGCKNDISEWVQKQRRYVTYVRNFDECIEAAFSANNKIYS